MVFHKVVEHSALARDVSQDLLKLLEGYLVAVDRLAHLLQYVLDDKTTARQLLQDLTVRRATRLNLVEYVNHFVDVRASSRRNVAELVSDLYDFLGVLSAVCYELFRHAHEVLKFVHIVEGVFLQLLRELRRLVRVAEKCLH